MKPANYYIRRYPRLISHIICESLGYASPTTAANILDSAHAREPNWCEWVWSCYGGNAVKVVREAIRNRRSHRGFMADYSCARRIVERARQGLQEPLLASWF